MFDKLDQQLPKLARCVAVCSEVVTTVDAAGSTLACIQEQMALTCQSVTQRLDSMEETIRDKFLDLKVDILDLKVDIISTTLALLERNIAT